MKFTILTQPLVQNVIGKIPFSIVAVKGKIFDVELTLNDTLIESSFYFQFIDETGKVVNEINADRSSILSGVKSSLPEELSEEDKLSMANNITDGIIKNILTGTKIERYNAMTIFANAYGLSLLPLEEQTGILNITNTI